MEAIEQGYRALVIMPVNSDTDSIKAAESAGYVVVLHDHPERLRVICPLRRMDSKVIEQIKEILNGIDKDEIEDKHGWWETSVEAEFGARKLAEVLNVLKTIGL